MKYGKTERISGIVILLSLAAILVPWLMSDPAPREERPQPSFTIEQPIDAPRRDVAEPKPPESIDLSSFNDRTSSDDEERSSEEVSEASAPTETDAPEAPRSQEQSIEEPSSAPQGGEAQEAQAQDGAAQVKDDPIAALMAQSESQRAAAEKAIPAAQAQGEWGVQVGTFGNPDNAARLKRELEEQGFPVYTRERSDDLTTVIVGPFASSSDGERASALIKERVNQQGLLVRVRD
ncbi:SPOR domain-containing protein [Vreelandella massiliensis]|uniref:SPOR domain-containing protein n=1 Tax=Vreelandella massiliensis TaxID=1816686 RepID=UPI00096A43A4|nr:SPOR domain-containing protein [Halomonas massiliensis]